MSISIQFFHGRGLSSWIVRAFSWRRGQKWADVPSHVGLRIDYTLYEAVVTGVQHRYHADYAPFREIPLLLDAAHALAVERWLEQQLGKRYDWVAILLDTIGRFLPKTQLRDLDNDKWDCSRLVAEALRVGGLKLPDARLPESPNDLRLFLESEGK